MTNILDMLTEAEEGDRGAFVVRLFGALCARGLASPAHGAEEALAKVGASSVRRCEAPAEEEGEASQVVLVGANAHEQVWLASDSQIVGPLQWEEEGGIWWLRAPVPEPSAEPSVY